MVMVVLMVMMMMPEEKERLALYCPSCHVNGDGPQLSTTTEITSPRSAAQSCTMLSWTGWAGLQIVTNWTLSEARPRPTLRRKRRRRR